jgi:uncharacterized repeat protein (TIGR02543 family)
MKKLLSIILSLVMVLCALPVSSFAYSGETIIRSQDGLWNYYLDVNNNAVIYTPNLNKAYFGSESNLTVPSMIDGHTVVEIGDHAFSRCGSLTSVVIPDTVISIGGFAFDNCNNLTSISIPDSVTNLEDFALSGVSSLTNITVDVNNPAFCSLDGVLFNKSMTEIIRYPRGKTATTYSIPNSVTSIGDAAFSFCNNLTSIIIPDSVTSIGEGAFEYCKNLTSITISDGVTSIGNYAFNGCDSLTSITIPDSVTSIGYSAFNGCDSLTCITIPDSVTSIGNSAFNGCTSLTSIIIPGGVTSIGDSAFFSCDSLTSIIIPDGVTSIGNYAFYGCGSLTSIIIPGGVTSIGHFAFFSCGLLSSIYIPDSVTSIGNYAFENVASEFSIYGAAGSYAETYANSNNIPFSPGYRVYIRIYVDGELDTSSIWSLKDNRETPNQYYNGSNINVAENGIFTPEDTLTLSISEIQGYGCDGTITNGTDTRKVSDGENPVTIVPEGFLFINLHFYSRQDYTTLYFRDPLTGSFFSQKYPKTKTSFIFPENSFTNLHGLFNNWNTASDGSGTAYRPNASIALPSADTSYYAVWDEAYFLSFNKNNGTGSMDKIGVVTSKPTLIVPECGFTRNGYAFTGWNTKSNGSGTTYQPNNTIILSANTTLYAQWTQAYTVYLHGNFGNDTTVRQEIPRGESANITANPFTNIGYRFVGWNTAADGSGTSYADGASLTPTANVHLYAQWVRDYDINDDGVEDINDIGFILSVSVGNITDATAAELAKADLNSDGVVDAFDAAELDRLMEAAGLFDWYAADSYYCMDGAGYMCLINGREYYKVNPGKAIIGTAYYECYNGFRGTGPILVSTDPDAVANNCSYYLPDIFEYTVSFEYLGTTWYAAGSDYLWENDHTSQRKLDGFYNSLEEAAIALLNTAGVAFGNPPASTNPWEAENVEYLMADTGNMCIINGREYYKVNTGRAIIGTAYYYIPSANWSGTGPILVSTDPDTVVNNCSYLPSDLFEYSISFEYLGLTWYAAESGYLWEGNHSSQRKLDGSYNSLEVAAKALIDAAGVTVNTGGSNTPANTASIDKGDVNQDGEVNEVDYAMVKSYVECTNDLLSTDYLESRYDTLKTQYPEGTIITQQYYCADYDGDKAVDAFDLFYLDKRINNIA